MSKKLLVATDGSEISGKAIAFARDYAQLTSAEIIVLFVIDNSLSFYAGAEAALQPFHNPGEFYGQNNPQAKIALSDAREILKGFDADYRVVVGSPAGMIISVAEQENCFHIVVGSRGLTGIRRVLLGNVAREVVALAHCPVTVVR